MTVGAKTHWRSGIKLPVVIRCAVRRRRARRAVPRELPRGLLHRHGRAQGRLPRERRGRLRPAAQRDRGRRPGALLRAQGALPPAARGGARPGHAHADRARGRRPPGLRRQRDRLRRHGRRRPARRRGARRRGLARGARPAHGVAARRRGDPGLGRPHLARLRAAGGELVARRGRRRALADRPRGLRAARRAARPRRRADRPRAVRARARGRLHPVARAAAPRRCARSVPTDRRRRGHAALRGRRERHARGSRRALPPGADAPPDRGARRPALPPGSRLRLGLHRARPGGRRRGGRATRSAPTTCARRSTASWPATSRVARRRPRRFATSSARATRPRADATATCTSACPRAASSRSSRCSATSARWSSGPRSRSSAGASRASR